MRVSEINYLQEKLSNLNESGKKYLSLVLNNLPKYPTSLKISFIKIYTYNLLMVIGYYALQNHIEAQLLFAMLISIPFYIEAITCLAIWNVWKAFYQETKNSNPDYEKLIKYCIDIPAIKIKNFTLAIMAAVVFSSVMVLYQNGIFYSLLASTLLLIVSYIKGNQCMLRIRFMLFISNDIGQFKNE